MSRKSRYLIYVITCPNCRSFYVGQTEHLRNRVTVHKEQIKYEKYRQVNVSDQLAKCSNGNLASQVGKEPGYEVAATAVLT